MKRASTWFAHLCAVLNRQNVGAATPRDHANPTLSPTSYANAQEPARALRKPVDPERHLIWPI